MYLKISLSLLLFLLLLSCIFDSNTTEEKGYIELNFSKIDTATTDKFTLLATNKDSEDTVTLYEWTRGDEFQEKVFYPGEIKGEVTLLLISEADGITVNASAIEFDTDDQEAPVVKTNLPDFYLENSGLVAFYPFTGNANDSSGYKNDGIISGAVLIKDRFGNAKGAYRFDGVDDQIQIADNTSIRMGPQLTISAWVYLFSEENSKGIVIEKGTTAGGWEYKLEVLETSNKFNLTIHNIPNSGYANILSVDAIPPNTWTNIAIVFNDSNYVELYMNGQLSGRSTEFNPSLPYTIGSAPMYIGIRRGWFNHPDPSIQFKGAIDDIRIYKRALLESEIQLLYNQGGWTG